MTKKRLARREKQPSKRPRKFFVRIDRDPAIQAAREELPVCMHEQEIVEAIHEHDVVVVTGATGSGKTTQVPQFLVEDGFGAAGSEGTSGMVVVTQPRRVAAVTCAERVARELNTTLGGETGLVGYHVRHDARLGDSVRVKFATDGILLREVENDLLLRRYSAVIIDEAHERSLNTDLLLSFLSRSVILRRQRRAEFGVLKLVIMSATLDADGILSGDNPLFPNPPVVNVPARHFPITVHFARRTYDDYVDEAFRKVCDIHRKLPPGGILVFLSGREEVERLCTRLRDEFGKGKIRVCFNDPDENPDPTNSNNPSPKEEPQPKNNDTSAPSPSPSPPGDTYNARKTTLELSLKVLPFYSLLPEPLQRRVFAVRAKNDHVEDDVRRVIVATNIAETSVTVPGIVYVVDSGRAKERVYKGEGCGRVSAFEVGWISQASAEQRAGRAGRTSPGHCYRLYSSAVYDQQFAAFRTPEILRVPADAVVLRLRAMGISHVDKFPFATPPPLPQLLHAQRLLVNLGALIDDSQSQTQSLAQMTRRYSSTPKRNNNNKTLLGVTRIGRLLATLPVEPRLGRLLLAAAQLDTDPAQLDAIADSVHVPVGTAPADRKNSNNGKSSKKRKKDDVEKEEEELRNTVALACRLGGILSVGTVLQRADSPDVRKAQGRLRDVRSDLLTELAAVCAVEHCGSQSQSRQPKSQHQALDVPAMRSLCAKLGLHAKCILEAIAIARQVEREVVGNRNTTKDKDKNEGVSNIRPPTPTVVQRLLRATVAGFGDHVARRMSRDEAAAAGVMPRLMSRAFATPAVDRPVFLDAGSSVRLDRNTRFVCYAALVEVEVKSGGGGGGSEDDDDNQRDDYDDDGGEDDNNDDGEGGGGGGGKESNNEGVGIGADGGYRLDALVGIEPEEERDRKRSSKKKLASKSGRSRRAAASQKRLVMRGVSVIDAQWVIDHADGMCVPTPDTSVPPVYHRGLRSVVETVRVSYRPGGWYLGTKHIPVHLLDQANSQSTSTTDDDRRRLHASVFATVLIDGSVSPALKVPASENAAHRTAFHTRVAHTLHRWRVASVHTLVTAMCTPMNAEKSGTTNTGGTAADGNRGPASTTSPFAKELLQCCDTCFAARKHHTKRVVDSWRKGLTALVLATQQQQHPAIHLHASNNKSHNVGASCVLKTDSEATSDIE